MTTIPPPSIAAPCAAQVRRVFMLGATGTIGRATVAALVAHGFEVVCFLRRQSATTAAPALTAAQKPSTSGAATLRYGDVGDAESLARDGYRGEHFDLLVSCMASRTGAPRDAWEVDHRAHSLALEAGRAAGITQVVLLSAICVQKPRLAFQHAKLAFEQILIESGLTYSIVRPTAFFKSLSGQIERVRRGKPFLVFGDGTLTACKPISDADLAAYLVACIDDRDRWNRILPIGGPGEPITPRRQGEYLFSLLDRPVRYSRVPVAFLDAIIRVLTELGRVIPPLADKAELARIGRYYATESMLVIDPATGQYDGAMTPSTGADTLYDYYAQVIQGKATAERGDHAVF